MAQSQSYRSRAMISAGPTLVKRRSISIFVDEQSNEVPVAEVQTPEKIGREHRQAISEMQVKMQARIASLVDQYAQERLKQEEEKWDTMIKENDLKLEEEIAEIEKIH